MYPRSCPFCSTAIPEKPDANASPNLEVTAATWGTRFGRMVHYPINRVHSSKGERRGAPAPPPPRESKSSKESKETPRNVTEASEEFNLRTHRDAPILRYLSCASASPLLRSQRRQLPPFAADSTRTSLLAIRRYPDLIISRIPERGLRDSTEGAMATIKLAPQDRLFFFDEQKGEIFEKSAAAKPPAWSEETIKKSMPQAECPRPGAPYASRKFTNTPE